MLPAQLRRRQPGLLVFDNPNDLRLGETAFPHVVCSFSECLNAHWFLTLADAAEKLEAWRRYYNEERPHGAIGNKVPIMLTKSGGATSPSP